MKMNCFLLFVLLCFVFRRATELFTWIHLADFLNEGFIKSSNYSATYWNHKVFVQALNKSVDSTNPSPLEMGKKKQKTHKNRTLYTRLKNRQNQQINTIEIIQRHQKLIDNFYFLYKSSSKMF